MASKIRGEQMRSVGSAGLLAAWLLALAGGSGAQAQDSELSYYYLSAPSKLALLVASDSSEDWSEFQQAKIDKDLEAVQIMMKKGKVFAANTGTKVRIVKTGFASHKVRIMEGSQKGKTGWIEMEYVADKPPPKPPQEDRPKTKPKKPRGR